VPGSGSTFDFAGLTDEDLIVCRNAVALYREIRPLVQRGTCGGWTSERASRHRLCVRGRPKRCLFAFQLTRRTNDTEPLRAAGLDPDRTYDIVAIDLAAVPMGPGPTWSDERALC